MSKQTGLNAQSIGLHNTQKVFEIIRIEGPISRIDIAEHLGLSKAAITAAVDRLLEKGLLLGKEDPEYKKVGPKPQLLSIKPDAALFVGIDVGGTGIGYGIGNLDGKILSQGWTQTGNTWEEVARQITEIFNSCDQWCDEDPESVQAVGLSVPGVVDTKGQVSFAPNIKGPDPFPIKSELENRISVPIFVENDVNLSALGEMNTEAARYTNLVFINIGTGIGAGVIINGELYHGGLQHAGEIGWMLINRDDIDFETDGAMGSLEAKLTGPSLARRARQTLKEKTDGIPAIDLDNITPKEVLKHSQDYPELRSVQEDWLEEWSIVLNNLAAILDPQLMVLGGGVSQSFTEQIIDKLRDNLQSTTQRPPKLMLSPDPKKAPLRGATELCLAEFSQWFS